MPIPNVDRRRRLWTLAAAAALWILAAGWTAADAAPSAETGPGWPQRGSDIEPDPQVVYGTLPNGFRYVLMPNRRPSDRVSLHLNVQAGSLHEDEHQQGIAHFLEHMMFNGTEHFDAGELVKFFQRIGMQFGPDANAHTSFDETVYDILLPDGGAENLQEGLRILKDYAEGALLQPEEIDRERRVILAEKRSRDSAGYRTFVAEMGFRFPGSLLSRRLPIGTEEDIRAADRERMKEFYDRWYRPEKMMLVAVGDFEPRELARRVEEMFSAVAARLPSAPEPLLEPVAHSGVRPFHHYEEEVGSTSVSIEVARIRPPVTDTRAFRRTQLLRSLAHRMIQHRLDRRLREPGSPFTSASAGSWVYLGQVESASVGAECEPGRWPDTLAVIEQMLRAALEHGFLPSELERVRREVLSELEAAVNQAPTRESGDLARQIIRHVNESRVFLSPEQERRLLEPMLAEATPETVLEALRAVWGGEHRLVLVTGNARLDDGNGSPEARIRQVFSESAAVAASPPSQEGGAAFPYLPAPETPGAIVERADHADIGVTQVRYANGVTLNLKSTDFKADEVQAAVVFGHGKAVEPAAQPGLAEMAPEVVTESGLGGMTRVELDRALAGTQVQAAFHVSEDRFQLRGSSTTDELERLLQLLHAHLEDPAFRPDAVRLVRERMLQRIDALQRTTEGALLLEGRRFLAGGDSRFGLPGADAVERIAASDIRDWLAPAMQSAQLEISLVGDFDRGTALRLVSRYFGGLSRRGEPAPPAPGRLPSFPRGGRLHVPLETQIPSAMTVVSYPTDDMWDIGRTRRLNILAHVFSDRLRVGVREKLGASYSPFAFSRPSRAYPGYGVFSALVEADPGQLEAVEAAVRDIAADLRENGVSAEELDRALEPTLTGIKDQRETNGYWLDTVLAGATRHPEQLTWARTIREDYSGITPEQVTRLARRYLVDEAAAVLMAAPSGTVAP